MLRYVIQVSTNGPGLAHLTGGPGSNGRSRGLKLVRTLSAVAMVHMALQRAGEPPLTGDEANSLSPHASKWPETVDGLLEVRWPIADARAKLIVPLPRPLPVEACLSHQGTLSNLHSILKVTNQIWELAGTA